MTEIPLVNVPNQSLSIQLDNLFYNITIKFIINVMTVTIVRAGVEILTNVRATPNMPLILYPYLENGNFIFFTVRGEYPNYNEFGLNQFLLYFSQDELDAIRERA